MNAMPQTIPTFDRTPTGSEPVDPLSVPKWALDLLSDGIASPRAFSAQTGMIVESLASPRFSLVTLQVPGASQLAPRDFERATADAYSAIAERLDGHAARYPVRFWNHIPDINRRIDDSLDQYMVFNAGRYAACKEWLGGEETFRSLLATASGVGHGGDELIIHALGADQSGAAIENPRQIPAYRYSQRFGPRPPCFARATRIARAGGGTMILVGGTSSVRGEDSLHVGDVALQLRETFDNLTSLARVAIQTSDAGLNSFAHVRAYFVRPGDLPLIASICTSAFVSARIEYMQANLCRPDLLVEIEGVALVEMDK